MNTKINMLLVVTLLTATSAAATSVIAAPMVGAKSGWTTVSNAETCVHRNRITEMYKLNGEMRNSQCFTLQSKKAVTGKRIYQNVSRDGTVIRKGKRLV